MSVARREPARVVEEFEQTLARLRTRHRHDPREELTRLLLLAIEREQLVSVAYRGELIQRRLAVTPLGPDAQRQAHRDTAILMPLTDFPPDFALIDAYDSAADGLVGVIPSRGALPCHRLRLAGDGRQ